jgi:hypothetical protein
MSSFLLSTGKLYARQGREFQVFKPLEKSRFVSHAGQRASVGQKAPSHGNILGAGFFQRISENLRTMRNLRPITGPRFPPIRCRRKRHRSIFLRCRRERHRPIFSEVSFYLPVLLGGVKGFRPPLPGLSLQGIQARGDTFSRRGGSRAGISGASRGQGPPLAGVRNRIPARSGRK